MGNISDIQWWGYIHKNGNAQARRFFSYRDLADANESDFVLYVYGPFSADSRDEALQIIKDRVQDIEVENR